MTFEVVIVRLCSVKFDEGKFWIIQSDDGEVYEKYHVLESS